MLRTQHDREEMTKAATFLLVSTLVFQVSYPTTQVPSRLYASASLSLQLATHSDIIAPLLASICPRARTQYHWIDDPKSRCQSGYESG
jgi:hypothetical protein